MLIISFLNQNFLVFTTFLMLVNFTKMVFYTIFTPFLYLCHLIYPSPPDPYKIYMIVNVHGSINIGISHYILQYLNINLGFSHACTSGMSQYMRRNVRKQARFSFSFFCFFAFCLIICIDNINQYRVHMSRG